LQISEKFDLPIEHSDLLLSSTYVYLSFLELSKADAIIFSDISFTECILNSMAGINKSSFIAKQMWKSAINIGDKYHFDRKHALHVAKTAVKIFDELKSIHNLSIKHRFILKLAALWHDIGIFIQNSEHHKHSYYLISNIEMPGLSNSDIQLIATIARYHRRSMPKKYHPEYISLKDRDRVVVSKLASILRIADALDRGHSQIAENLKIETLENEIILNVSFKKSGWLEKMHFQSKRNLFDRVFGINIELIESK
jgi:exopolyphosphatase/guanosine-5'-triphosphate,3'-diphosphate pyrophosphatase